MKTALKIITITTVIIAWLFAFNAWGQTNLESVPPPNQIPADTNFVERAAQYVGVPSGASLDVAAGLSYAPSFKSGTKVGWWVAGVFATGPDSLLNYEVGIQHLRPSKYEGSIWQPNGLLLLKKTFHAGDVSITPLIEAGAAFDARFDPYGIYGAGVAVGWRNFGLLAGAERWSGARGDNFTVLKIAPYYSFSF